MADRMLTLAEVHALARRALEGAGARGIQLDQAALSILEAEADGIRVVGLAYLPTYCAHLQCGKVKGDAKPTHRQVAPAAILSDADNGFSHAAFHEAMDDFHALAKRQAVAALAIRHSSSAGVVGWFVERTARAGLLGLGFANSSSLMAAWGGRTPFFGTNPIAYAVPRQDNPPLVVDMATSQVAWVTVKRHMEEGKPIPLGWGLDAEGRYTTDPAQVINGGSMGPAGGYKGALLALLVDVLAGGIAGPHFAYQASPFGNAEGGPPDVGQLFLAISPDAFGEGFGPRLEAMLAAMVSDPGVRLPGDSRHAHREKAERHGVAVPEDLIATLDAYAQ
ncbi:MAG: Ldh family oxidoreductase [Hyphomicrobiales bacterium]